MEINVKNNKLRNWIKEVAEMCNPDDIYICNGSTDEYDLMMKKLLDHGSAIKLKTRPNSYLFRSDPSDVARVEDRTYISTSSKDEAGPTNNWIDPAGLKETMKSLYRGCMKGRTMYVIPFSMGPIGSPISKIGVEITLVLMGISFHAFILLAHPWEKGRRMSFGRALRSKKNISVISLRRTLYGRTGQVMVATHCSERNVLHYASHPRWPEGKGGWQNICSYCG
jgi:hypothetical protein